MSLVRCLLSSLWDTEHLAGEDHIRVADLVPVRLMNTRPQRGVSVPFLGNSGQRVAGQHLILGKAVVWIDKRRPEYDRHDDLAHFAPVRLGNPEHLDGA